MRTLLLLVMAAAIGRGEIIYKVRLSAGEGGAVVELPQERYVAAVLAGEVGAFRNEEALKAMAVAARTYAAYFRSRHRAEGYDFCSTSHCQRAILKDAGGRFQKAAEATRGQLLWFHSRPALAVYTQDCGGRSEAARAVWSAARAPYLTVHADPYCRISSRSEWTWEIAAATLGDALREAGMRVPTRFRQVVVVKQTTSGRVRTLSLAGNGESSLISASSFRFAVGRTLGWKTIRSDRYAVKSVNGNIRFEGRGQGHGVGLCQDGADEMAVEGKTYRQILNFYYPGASVSVLANDVKWTSVHGEHASIFAARKTTAAEVAQLTNEEISALRSRYGLAAPANLKIYVYPDMESYRNGTGEPGWVAAHTFGTQIETQPLQTLQQHGGFRPVVRHELLHAIVESMARSGLPLWFREGLVENLAGDHVHLAPAQKSGQAADGNIGSREDAVRTRDAYAAAEKRVAQLRARYGIAELLRWVREGLPEEIARSSASKKPANIR
ncbi:MAG TPA: SpoIID/LytB domain-containing protein [Bryobacteraceae bacterium]|nr:SpoIID/LytB domain-containing protein [Bryobacteraceae bacterium]